MYADAEIYRAPLNPALVQRQRERAQPIGAGPTGAWTVMRETLPPPKPIDPLAYLDGPKQAYANIIMRRVAAWHGMGMGELIDPCRIPRYVDARNDAIVAVFLNCGQYDPHACKFHPPSLPAIGRLFSRHHTSILHSLRKRGVK